MRTGGTRTESIRWESIRCMPQIWRKAITPGRMPGSIANAKALELAKVSSVAFKQTSDSERPDRSRQGAANRTERRMTNEASLNEVATRGLRAEELLDNELLSEAFTALEASYISAWRAT